MGESGRELFIPNRNGQIVPIAAGDSGGAQSVDNRRTYSVNFRGEQVEITAALRSYNAGLNRTLGARMNMNRRWFG